MNLIVSQAAGADIERLHAFLADKNPEAAQRVAAILAGAIESLRQFPERGRPLRQPVRELVVPFGHSAYVLSYTYSAAANEVVVHRIFHGRERRQR